MRTLKRALLMLRTFGTFSAYQCLVQIDEVRLVVSRVLVCYSTALLNHACHVNVDTYQANLFNTYIASGCLVPRGVIELEHTDSQT